MSTISFPIASPTRGGSASPAAPTAAAAISTIEYGEPATQRDLLEKLSPLGKLDRIRAAMMVQHGTNDTNVPVVEAEQIVKHLKSRNVPAEYVLFPDEGTGGARFRTGFARRWRWSDSSTST